MGVICSPVGIGLTDLAPLPPATYGPAIFSPSQGLVVDFEAEISSLKGERSSKNAATLFRRPGFGTAGLAQ